MGYFNLSKENTLECHLETAKKNIDYLIASPNCDYLIGFIKGNIEDAELLLPTRLDDKPDAFKETP